MTTPRNAGVKPKVGRTSATGPGTYSQSTRPTITFNDLRIIESLEDVKLIATGGIDAVPVSVSGNIVTYALRVRKQHTHTATGSALGNHAHTENTASTYLQNATTAAITGGTPAATNSNSPATLGDATAVPNEVANSQDTSGYTIYGVAFGY